MKTVLITGGATGIGAKCAEVFAKSGYLTLISYNKSRAEAERLKEDAIKNQQSLDTFPCDVLDAKSVEKMFAEITKKYGKIDILINNAGVSLIKEFGEVTESDFDTVLGVNLKGVFLCCQQAVKIMLRRRSGRIINISSMWGLCGASFETVYSAAKAGVIGLTKALAREVSANGISVNAVAPGFIQTDMNKDVPQSAICEILEKTPLGRLGTCEDIANLVFYLADGAPDFITGEVINISGGLVT